MKLRIASAVLSVPFIFVCFFSNAQSVFRLTVADDLFDHDNYAIKEIVQGGTLQGYVVAGTRVDSPVKSDCHVMYLDPNGNILFDISMNHGPKEAYLDVDFDRANQQIILTGYVEFGPQDRHMLVTIMDLSGIVTGDRIYTLYRSSMGLSIAYDRRREQYIVGGMTIDDPELLDSPSSGFVLKLDQFMDPLWMQELKGANGDGFLTGINDVQVTRTGILALGGYRANCTLLNCNVAESQGTAIVMLRHNGNVRWDLSRNYSNCSGEAVGAVYQQTQGGRVYVVSNISHAHQFQVSVIRLANTPNAFVFKEYYIDILNDPGVPGAEAVALSVESSRTGPSHLVVMGATQSAPYTQTTGHMPVFMVEFQKNTGVVSNRSVHTVANTGYDLFMEPILNPFYGMISQYGAPYSNYLSIYTASTLAPNDNQGYTYVWHRLRNGRYNTEIVSTDGNFNTGDDCSLEPGTTIPVAADPAPDQPMVITPLNVIDIIDVEPLAQSVFHAMEALCPPGGEKSGTIQLSGLSATIYPNPANEQLTISFDNEIMKEQDLQIQILDIGGRVVHADRTTLPIGTLDHTLNVSELSPGTYLVHLSGEAHSQMIRMVIDR